jgi:hypothetical protein
MIWQFGHLCCHDERGFSPWHESTAHWSNRKKLFSSLLVSSLLHISISSASQYWMGWMTLKTNNDMIYYIGGQL